MSERTLTTERKHEIGYMLYKESVERNGIRLDDKGIGKIIEVFVRTQVSQDEIRVFIRTLIEEIASGVTK